MCGTVTMGRGRFRGLLVAGDDLGSLEWAGQQWWRWRWDRGTTCSKHRQVRSCSELGHAAGKAAARVVEERIMQP